jgi:hypothetical protein
LGKPIRKATVMGLKRRKLEKGFRFEGVSLVKRKPFSSKGVNTHANPSEFGNKAKFLFDIS